MNKKIPMRTCIVTKEVLPKKELIILIKASNGMKFYELCN